MRRLFLANIPCDCHDIELRNWIERHGFNVESLRVIRDTVAGVSPAFGYVSLGESAEKANAIEILNGQDLKGRRVQVKEDWRHERHCG